MASAAEQLEDESRDRQFIGSNASGAGGAERKMEGTDLGSKYPKDPSREGAVSAIAVSSERGGRAERA